MAHIHDILSEITQFLNGRDHSCSERFRSLAEDYAAACKDVIDSLEECRKLIASGQALQALNQNRQSSPTLTERARFLMFPGRPQWLELCSLYKVSFPPEFDMDLINQLESSELSESVEQTSDLISQWHILGHTGTNHEKIVLLRKLIQKDKTTKIWRKNLEIAEKAWCRELLNNAAEAQKMKDYACLDSIVIQLNSPDLLHPVQPSLLEPFQKDLRSYRTVQMQKKQEKIIAEIMNAYNMEDINSLGAALCKWSILSAEPLFVAPNSTDADLLKKAQEHHRKKTEQIILQNKADELHRKINAQIGACEPFPQIRASMFQLKELALPIDPDLETRYKALEDEYILTQKRKTGTKRFVWCSMILIFCAAVCAAVFIVNRITAIRNICSEMQSFLQNKKPKNAIVYYEELKKQKSPYAADENVQALYTQALGLRKQYESEITVFGKLLTDLKSKMNLKDIYQTGKLFAEANSGKLYHTAQQEEELLSLNIQQKNIILERQKNRNNEFERQFNQLLSNSKSLMRALRTPDKLNIEETKQKFEDLQNQKKKLLRNQLLASADTVEAKRDTLENISRLLQEQMKCLNEYVVLRGKLYAPESVYSFLESLSEISKLQQYSDVLSYSFSEALRQKESLQQYLSVSANASAADMMGSRHPYIKDVCTLNPSPKVINDIRMTITQMKKNAAANWDLYEIVLEANKKKMFFYLRPPLDDDNLRVYRTHGRAGGAFKDIRMNVCKPDGQLQELIFKISSSKNKGLYNLKRVNTVAGIPDQFTDVPRSQMLSWASRNDVDKALHYKKFIQTLDRLLKITDAALLRNQIVHEIKEYILENNMNPAAQILIIQNLMKLYGSISMLDFHFSQQVRQQSDLAYADPLDYMADTSKLQNKLKYFTTPAFQKLLISRNETVQLYQNILSVMSPNPAGVIYKTGSEYWVHFFENTKPSPKYFACLNNEDNPRFYIFTEQMLKTAKESVSKLPAPLRKVYNGTVFFAPLSLPSPKEFQDMMKHVFSIPSSMPVFAERTKE